MYHNKNDIALIINQINDVDKLLQKLAEFSRTSPEALALFFQDQELIAGLVKKLQSNSSLAKQSYDSFVDALKQKNSLEILKKLCADCDEDALSIGLLFQDPKKVDTLLKQLQKKGGLDKLFSDFFAPMLKRLSTQTDASNTLGGVLLSDALVKCWLDPRCKAIHDSAIQSLQTLSSIQRITILNTLKDHSFIKEKFASLSEEEFKKTLMQLSLIFLSQSDQEYITYNRKRYLGHFGTKSFEAIMSTDNAQSMLRTIGQDPKTAIVHIKTWLQDKTQVQALLTKLAATNSSDALFNDLLIPALNHFRGRNNNAEVTALLARTIAHALLSAKTMSADTIIALREALTATKARLITEQLTQASVDEVANIPTAQLTAMIQVINKPGVAERQKLSASLQNYFSIQLDIRAAKKAEEEFEQSFTAVSSDKTWIVDSTQQKYVKLLIQRFRQDNQSGARLPIPKKYLVELADCLYNQDLLRGDKGEEIIVGLQKTLSNQEAKTLSQLLTQNREFTYAPELKNITAILSGDDPVKHNPDRVAIVHDFYAKYLNAVTSSFSHAMSPEHQEVFMEGLKSVPVAGERKALAELALRSNRPPSQSAIWWVNKLPAWLCWNSLRERARPAAAFTAEHVATLQHIAQNNGQLPEVINGPAPIVPVPAAIAEPATQTHNHNAAASAARQIVPQKKRHTAMIAETAIGLPPTIKTKTDQIIAESAPMILPVKQKVRAIIPEGVKTINGFNPPTTIGNATQEAPKAVQENTAGEPPDDRQRATSGQVQASQNRFGFFHNEPEAEQQAPMSKLSQALSLRM